MHNQDNNTLPNKKDLFKFFFLFQRKHISIASITGLLLTLGILLQLPMPLITRHLIDKIIPSGNFAYLNIFCLILLIVTIFRQLINYGMEYFTAKFKAGVFYDIEMSLYQHIQKLPLNYFYRRPTGYILSRISEISTIESIMMDTVFLIMKDSITIMVGAVAILTLHPFLGMISIGLLPFFVLALKKFHCKIKSLNKMLREEHAQYYGKLERNLSGIEKIKSNVLEDAEYKRVSERKSKVILLEFKSDLLSALASSISSFIGMMAPFIVLWYGGSEIMMGNLSLGTFFAINAFLGYLYNPANRLTNKGYSISQAAAGLERIYEIFKEREECFGEEEIERIDSICFKKVNFSYHDSAPVLKDLNLEIKKGDKVALIGGSGEGKSTLVKLLLKFHSPISGKIIISEKDFSKINAKSIRSKIAFISQTPFLLDDELNKKLNCPVFQTWLNKLKWEKQTKTQVRDNQNFQQNEFSGGEIQKLEIIEALLKDADMLIVDEGTSNIDFAAENAVLEKLFRDYKDKIILFIAHRLTTVSQFHRILVLDKGSIIEEGSHKELIERKGKYWSLWGGKRIF